MHRTVFARPSQEVLLVVSDRDGVDWVLVLEESRHEQPLRTYCLQGTLFRNLKLLGRILGDQKALLLCRVEVGDKRRLCSLWRHCNLVIHRETLRYASLSVSLTHECAHRVCLLQQRHLVQGFKDLPGLRCHAVEVVCANFDLFCGGCSVVSSWFLRVKAVVLIFVLLRENLRLRIEESSDIVLILLDKGSALFLRKTRLATVDSLRCFLHLLKDADLC